MAEPHCYFLHFHFRLSASFLGASHTFSYFTFFFFSRLYYIAIARVSERNKEIVQIILRKPNDIQTENQEIRLHLP